MNLNLGEAVKCITSVFHENAFLREQNAVLSCCLIFTTISWLRERHKRLQKEKKEQEGE